MQTNQACTITYGVAKIEAPAVWDLGYNGQGIVVASIDTGVNEMHQALAGRFVGDYGWYDAFTYPVPLACSSPCDADGHGTHTMGTMTGTGGIGIAPVAKWAACKACSTLLCSSNALTACGQLFACPTKKTMLGGQTSDCTKAPHVINNSWGGSGNDTWFNDIIKEWDEADIIGVFAGGNSGSSGCGSIGSPADQGLPIFAVGATDENDALASFSSLGPSVNGMVKPDVAAPGVNVLSANYKNSGDCVIMSGTSMATPHVVGTVALLLSKAKSKNITLSYTDVFKAITQNTDQSTLSGGVTCGGINPTIFPNNDFGYGRVNALTAINTI